MPLAKCVRCKTMFNKESSSVCPPCLPAETEDQDKVRALLEKQPDLSTEDAAEKAEVDIAVIIRMLKDGILADSAASGPAMCGQCGAPAISASKRLCQPCLDKLNSNVARAQASIKMDDRKPAEVGEYMNVRQAFTEKRRR